eukprot:NODE_77_length_23806_cov_0.393892.p10 type:complete len:188 gc:universal NODE_77_length_23806_cov_0.393892:6391-6954(+)
MVRDRQLDILCLLDTRHTTTQKISKYIILGECGKSEKNVGGIIVLAHLNSYHNFKIITITDFYLGLYIPPSLKNWNKDDFETPQKLYALFGTIKSILTPDCMIVMSDEWNCKFSNIKSKAERLPILANLIMSESWKLVYFMIPMKELLQMISVIILAYLKGTNLNKQWFIRKIFTKTKRRKRSQSKG